MALDIGGTTITNASIGGVSYDAGGRLAGSPPGYSGWKDIPGNDQQWSPFSQPWPVNTALWSSGLNTSTGLFTAPVAGLYACGANGIANGFYGTEVSDGKAAFAKNGVAQGWIHWNMHVNNGWQGVGCHMIFNCAAGDTISFHINSTPVPGYNDGAATNNRGFYPHAHHHIWVLHIG